MSGIVGIFMIGFGILWTVMAAQASIVFALFGVLWTCIAIATTVYNFKNAKSKNRFSAYDITDENEEPDPFNERFGGNLKENSISQNKKESIESKYCPYCGIPVEKDFEFCNNCGKRLP